MLNPMNGLFRRIGYGMLGILVSGLVSGFLNVAAAQQLSELTQKAALQAAYLVCGDIHTG